MSAVELWFWRHPRADGAAGRCIGRTDLPVDPRRAKRLAHRIRAAARRHALPRVVAVSPAARCRAVGARLRRWGWRVRVDARLRELDFGRWDGRAWAYIAPAEVAAWEADFWTHAPGGGEPLAALAARARGFVAGCAGPTLVVGHGGWIVALGVDAGIAAAGWPAPPPCGSLTRRTSR